MLAVLETTRSADHRNASTIRAGSAAAGGPRDMNRAIGVSWVSLPGCWHGLRPGCEPVVVELEASGVGSLAELTRNRPLTGDTRLRAPAPHSALVSYRYGNGDVGGGPRV